MSPGGRSEQVGVLRDAIARIEGDGSVVPHLGRDHERRRITLGADDELTIDKVLRGGLLRGTLYEVLAAAPGDAGTASGFALALAARLAAASRIRGRASSIVWILEETASAEHGAPYAPGLAAHGLDPAHLILVRTANGAETLWAMEEALKCRALACVVADLWRTKPYDLTASRRLVLAAQRSRVPGILVPAGAAGTAQALSSAARIRFEIAALPNPVGGLRPARPGTAAWALRLVRIRAGPDGHAEAVDPEKFWPLVWDHEEACFRDALPLPSPALPRHGHHPAAAGRRRARDVA